jgi:hypothetical protein
VQIFVIKSKRIYNSEVIGVDGRIILTLILGKYGESLLIGFIWLRMGTSGGVL